MRSGGAKKHFLIHFNKATEILQQYRNITHGKWQNVFFGENVFPVIGTIQPESAYKERCVIAHGNFSATFQGLLR